MATRKLTKAEKAAITKPHFRELWGRKYKVKPALVEKVFGDGKRLLILTPITTRPNYYVVQIDSSWELDAYEFLDHLEEIYDAIDEQYGCDDDIADGEEAPDFPTLHHGGSTWWRGREGHDEKEGFDQNDGEGRDGGALRWQMKSKRATKIRRIKNRIIDEFDCVKAPAEYAVYKGDQLLARVVKMRDGWRVCVATERSQLGVAVSPVGLNRLRDLRSWSEKKWGGAKAA